MTRRPDAQSVYPRPKSLRLVIGNRSSNRRELRGDRDWDGDRRLDSVSLVDMRDSGNKADGRFDLAERCDPYLGFAGHRRPDDADRR